MYVENKSNGLILTEKSPEIGNTKDPEILKNRWNRTPGSHPWIALLFFNQTKPIRSAIMCGWLSNRVLINSALTPSLHRATHVGRMEAEV